MATHNPDDATRERALSADLLARCGIAVTDWNDLWSSRDDDPSVADVVVEVLRGYGVTKVFGIPGIHNMALWASLADAGIDLVLVRHEQTAHYAADGYFRSTGRLGVCLTTSGPGAANTAAATGEALTSGSGVLHITTSTPLAVRSEDPTVRRGTVHELPFQYRIFEPLVRTAIAVERTRGAAGGALQAVGDAVSGWPAPTYLEFPADLLSATVDRSDLRVDGAPAPDPAAPTPVDETLRRVLETCERPVIWAGAGSLDADVARLADHLAAPVVTTLTGRSAIDSDHALAVAAPPHEPAVAELVESADVVLAIGTDWDGQNTQQWRLAPRGTVVRVDLVKEQLAINLEPDVAVLSDARAFIDAVISAVPSRASALTGARAVVAQVRSEVADRIDNDSRDTAGARVVSALSAAIPGDVPVVADMTMVGYWASGYLRRTLPRTFMYPMGWGTLGYGLPLSVGVAHGSGKPTVAVIGDAGFLFAAGELATLAERQLPVVVVLFNDEAYGVLAYNLEEEQAKLMRGLRTPNFVALAQSFGIDAVKVAPDGLQEAVAAAILRGRPALIEVPNIDDPPVSIVARWPLKERDHLDAGARA